MCRLRSLETSALLFTISWPAHEGVPRLYEHAYLVCLGVFLVPFVSPFGFDF